MIWILPIEIDFPMKLSRDLLTIFLNITFVIAKINMFLHGLDSADIRRGDTLANPQFLTNTGSLQTYDITVANPPYSIKDWEYEAFISDKFGRVDGYTSPPQKNADFAFV